MLLPTLRRHVDTSRTTPMRWAAPIMPLLAAACGPTGAPPPTASATAEDAAVTRLVAANPGWRLADSRDHGDSAGVRRQREREPGFTPYRRRGDWNGDGLADLAVVLVRDTIYRAVWLRGTATGFGPAEPLGETPDLRMGGLFDIDGALVVGPFESDAVWVWRWNAATGRLELADDDT